MPYSKLTRTPNGRAAIAYALNGCGHDGSEHRNLYVGGVNMLPSDTMPYADQMDRYWCRADSKNKTQVNRIIASFSRNELDPDDPESPLTAAQICEEFVREYYPGRQALICMQNDGKGHNLHAHILVNNVSMCEVQLPGEKKAQKPYSGCKGYQLKGDSYVRNNFDRAAEKYITLDKGPKAGDKVTQNERRMRQHNAECAPEDRKYIWKDDLKGRVAKAMSEASDKDDFLRKLTENGVEGTYHESKKGQKYYTYELTDLSGFGDGKIPGNPRSRSYKLGADYDFETVDRLFPDRPSPSVQKAPSVPQAGPQRGQTASLADGFGKRQRVPLKAAQVTSKVPSVPQPRFGKRMAKPASAAPAVPEPAAEEVRAPQFTGLPPAELERQRREKERLEAESLKRQNVLQQATPEEYPYPIPQKAQVVRRTIDYVGRLAEDIMEDDRRKQREDYLDGPRMW